MIKAIRATLSWKIVALMLSGILFHLAFAPYSWFIAAPIALAGLFELNRNAQSRKQSFYFGWSWGLFAFFPGLSWVHVSISDFSATPTPIAWLLAFLLIAVMALYIGLLCLSFRVINHRARKIPALVLWPLLWLVFECLRSWAFTGFPWLLVGTATLGTLFESWIPVGSVFLASVVVAVLAATIASVVACIVEKQRNIWLGISAMVLLTAVSWLVGLPQWAVETEQRNTVSLVQGNIPQDRKWLPQERIPTIEKYIELTKNEWQQDIIVWPEAAIPLLKERLEYDGTMDHILSANTDGKSTLITGLLQQAYDYNRFYNGVYAFGDGQGQYFKKRLVLFGEYVPFESVFRGIIDFFNLPMSTIVPGVDNQDWLYAHSTSLAPALCYEIAYPFLVRSNLVKEQGFADMLITISNDAWFGRSIGPLQHAEIAQVRALELARPLLRATNTGVTIVVDHQGQVLESLPQFEDGVLRAELHLVKGKTPWAMFGVWSLILGTAILLCLIGLLVLLEKKLQSTSDNV